MKVTGVSVVIPNYNGRALLGENLPTVIAAMERWGGEYELIVVDDCSTDESRRFLMECFPKVRLISNEVNSGFSKTCNRGFREANYPVVLCVNTDVRMDAASIAPVLKHFGDESVFAVTPTIRAGRERKNQGVVVGSFSKGFIRGGFAGIDEHYGARENLYAIGACAAYDREKLLALGGYAEIYSPYLFEDVDLSYRAWKRGWRSVYEPGVTVCHASSSSIGKTKRRHKRRIYFRNRFLFHWINLTEPSFRIRNIFHTALRLLFSFLWFDFSYYVSFYQALKRYGEVKRVRRTVIEHLRLSDREIIGRTGKAGY